MTQLNAGAAIPVVHTVELLDWATGGPLPPALANVHNIAGVEAPQRRPPQ
jgi:glycolate oxidase iron-sulfur subunit